jgi:hypothetical protein
MERWLLTTRPLERVESIQHSTGTQEMERMPKTKQISTAPINDGATVS